MFSHFFLLKPENTLSEFNFSCPLPNSRERQVQDILNSITGTNSYSKYEINGQLLFAIFICRNEFLFKFAAAEYKLWERKKIF